MNSIKEEQKLFCFHFFSSVLYVFSIVTFSVPWGHWSYTLDRCNDQDCGCILYGKSYSDLFVGGRNEYCQFVTFGQIPLLLINIILTFYHGVRAYIKARSASKKNIWRGNPLLSGSRRKKSKSERDSLVLELEPPQRGGVIALVVNSFVELAVLLTVFGFFLDGYFRSCKEYRRILTSYLHASGRVATILNDRLICSSIFDFMDFLQPERRRQDQIFEQRRDRINTGVSLLLSKFSLILNIVICLYVLVLNFKVLAKRMRSSRR